VFLLTALGTLLSVLSARLGRIVDRSRVLASVQGPPDVRTPEQRSAERALLFKRRKLINHAITCVTSAALTICVLIASAFTGFLLHANFASFIAALFIAAMTAFIAALIFFLREILHAVTSPHL
jgi:hypothetical protein